MDNFYPRPPGGGRPMTLSHGLRSLIFLSTPSGWRATRIKVCAGCITTISIHALRVEGDPRCWPFMLRNCAKFLSTPSGWRATAFKTPKQYNLFISIHALRVEGDRLRRGSATATRMISIHALRVEGDGIVRVSGASIQEFLSTPSGWRATGATCAPRPCSADFYPRPPGGGRL